MITIDKDKSYRVTGENGLYDYELYTTRTGISWRAGDAADSFYAGVYESGENAPRPPLTADASERVEKLQPGVLLEPSSHAKAPYRIMGVLYQALFWSQGDAKGAVGNGSSTTKPDDGKTYAWFQALWVERTSDKKKCFIWTVHQDIDFIEPVADPVAPVDTKVTIVGGSTTYAVAVVEGGKFVEFKTEVKPGVPEWGGGSTNESQYYGLALVIDEDLDAQERTISFQCVLGSWFHTLPAESAQWPDMSNISPQICPRLFVDVDVPIGHPNFTSIKEGSWWGLRFAINEVIAESLRMPVNYLRSEECDPLTQNLFPQNDLEVQLVRITAPNPDTLLRLMDLVS